MLTSSAKKLIDEVGPSKHNAEDIRLFRDAITDSRLWVETNGSLGFCSLCALPRLRILCTTVGVQACGSLREVAIVLLLHKDDLVTPEGLAIFLGHKRCGQRWRLLKQPRTQATVGRSASW